MKYRSSETPNLQ